MLARTIAITAVLPFLGNPLPAQENTTNVRVGDFLDIEMAGDLAKEYARRCHDPGTASIDGLRISATAIVAQQLPDGRIRIEHSASTKRADNLSRLVTLTATVDPKTVTVVRTPRGTPIYASPADHQKGSKPVLTKKDTKTFQLQLSELKNLKLRTWALAEEIGDGNTKER